MQQARVRLFLALAAASGAPPAFGAASVTSASNDLGAPGRDTSFGYGRVNLCRAAGGACTYTGGG
jgi:hypothetical protein